MQTNSRMFARRILHGQVGHALAVVLGFVVIYVCFFSPVIFGSRLLAPGDALAYYLPAYIEHNLWEPLLWGGYPAAADPQTMTWYPLALVLSRIPGSWNVFVIAAYVLASSFMYGYAYSLTSSRLAATIAGITYGMSGFLVAHLGHTSIVHAAAWAPLFIWSLEMLRRAIQPRWVLFGTFSVAASALAGHPQVYVYMLGLGVFYVFATCWRSDFEKWKYVAICVAVTLLGSVVAAVQFLPAEELVRFGPRAEMSFKEFVSFRIPLRQTVQFFFPFAFGGVGESPYAVPYFGKWNLTELAGYSGILPVLLAIVAIRDDVRTRMVLFWFVAGLVAFLLALGDATPLGRILYHVPLVNKFRAPARLLLIVIFAISVLAAVGVVVLQRYAKDHRSWKGVVQASLLFLSVAMLAFLASVGRIQTMAERKALGAVEWIPWLNPAIGVPLILFALSIAALAIFSRRPDSKVVQIGLVALLVVDLASFGWFVEWRYRSPDKTVLDVKPAIARYRDTLLTDHQRAMPALTQPPPQTMVDPNISKVWGVPSASGYGPLLLSRVQELLGLQSWGGLAPTWPNPQDRSLDIMGVRYVFVPQEAMPGHKVVNQDGMVWSQDNMMVSLGAACGRREPRAISFELGTRITVDTIGVVSTMGCSTAITNGAKVAEIVVTDITGRTQRLSMQAGRDTAEWAIDCEDVKKQVQHARAPLFSSFEVKGRQGEPCEGHLYKAMFSMKEMGPIRSVRLEEQGNQAIIELRKISVMGKDGRISHPISIIEDNPRWRYIEDVDGSRVFENQTAMPRAWLVSQVVSAKPDEIRNAVRSSILNNGRAFDPATTALVEEPFSLDRSPVPHASSAQIVNLASASMEVHTHTAAPAFLVLSDIYYPGWYASIDGRPTHLFRTNYVLRGVMVPAGGHVVRLEYRPSRLYWGMALTGTAAMLLVVLMVVSHFRRKTEVKEH